MDLSSFILAKTEVTYGVNPTPAAGDVIWAENIDIKPTGQVVASDPAKPGMAGVKGTPYGQVYSVGFDVPLVGSGTAGTAPKWGVLAKACGFSETVVASTSVTYAPLVSPASGGSVALIGRVDRRAHTLLGARGRMGLKCDAGKRPMLRFDFMALFTAVATGALPVQADATWTGWNDALPIAQGRTTFSFGGTNLPLRSLSLDAKNNVVFTDIPHQENVLLLGERGHSGNLKVTKPLASSVNFESIWDAQSQQTIALVHGATGGSIVTLNAKTYIDQPAYSVEDKQDVVSCGLRPLPSTIALDDDVSIVLT